MLHLTPEGKRVVEAAFKRHAEQLESAMAVLSRSENRSLYTLVKKLGLFAAGDSENNGRRQEVSQ